MSNLLLFGPTKSAPAIPKPTRQQLCSVRNHFQGLTVSTQQFGPDRQWFDPDVADLTLKADRFAVYAAHRAVGDTHLNLSLDLGGLNTLDHILDIALEAIIEGGMTGIILMCMGDGQLHGGDHDPGALGFEWLMANFGDIYSGCLYTKVDKHNLADHIIFVPGYDGVVPAWQPFTKVNDFADMARLKLDINGSGALGIELSAGYATWSGESNDWATASGQSFDVILQEGPIDMGPPAPIPANWPTAPDSTKKRWTQVYQMAGRMVHPFTPIPHQPDDLHPPFLLAAGTPRGPFYYVFWEFDTYRWTSPWRNGGPGITIAEIDAHRQAERDMGCTLVG